MTAPNKTEPLPMVGGKQFAARQSKYFRRKGQWFLESLPNGGYHINHRGEVLAGRPNAAHKDHYWPTREAAEQFVRDLAAKEAEPLTDAEADELERQRLNGSAKATVPLQKAILAEAVEDCTDPGKELPDGDGNHWVRASDQHSGALEYYSIIVQGAFYSGFLGKTTIQGFSIDLPRGGWRRIDTTARVGTGIDRFSNLVVEPLPMVGGRQPVVFCLHEGAWRIADCDYKARLFRDGVWWTDTRYCSDEWPTREEAEQFVRQCAAKEAELLAANPAEPGELDRLRAKVAKLERIEGWRAWAARVLGFDHVTTSQTDKDIRARMDKDNAESVAIISDIREQLAECREKLATAEQQLAERQAINTRLRRAISFFVIAIRSGESWTDDCQKMLDAARDVAAETTPDADSLRR